MKFKDFKQYISLIDRISICDKETLEYRNFITIKDVDNSYDELYVFGVGLIESEFYLKENGLYSSNPNDGKLNLISCIEIILDKKPRFQK